jgi:LuxR family maltose regulon positive regulatory protein
MKRRVRFLPPRPSSDAADRPVVRQRLEAAAHTPLTLLVAPPGFGKTTALAAWLSAAPEGVVYFGATPRDADLQRFVTLFVSAIQTVFPAAGDATLGELDRGEVADAVAIAESLADELADAPRDITVAIDDLHAISGPDVYAFLGELLRFGLPSLHLVLASRHQPMFPWARLRLEGRLHEIGPQELRLSESQIGDILGGAGIPDSAGRLAGIVWQQTEGWPAGVRGIALALQGTPTPLSGDALQSEAVFSHIEDFLVQEVFTQQPPEVQDALMRLAMLERFDGELAEALLAGPDPGATRGLLLAELMTACAYLEPEGDPGWVRFHPLFRQFLRNEFARHSREAHRRELLHRAGGLLAARGMADAAIQLLSNAGELDEAASLVEREMHAVLAQQDWRTLEAWLDALPQAFIEERPWLMVGRVWISHLSGRYSLLATYVERIQRCIARGHPDAEALRGECAMFSIFVEGDPSAAVAALTDAVGAIPPAHRFAHGLTQFYLGLARQACGRSDEALSGLTRWVEVHSEQIDGGFIVALQGTMFVHHASGHLFACEESAAEVLKLAWRHDLPVAAAWARRGLGTVAYMQNRLDEAERQFSAVVADSDRCNLVCAAEAFAGLAYTYAAQGDLAAAHATLQRASDMALERQAVDLLTMLRPAGALLALREEPPDVEKALGLTNGVTADTGLLAMVRHPVLTRVMALLVAGRPEDLTEAAMHLAALEDRAVQIHNVPVQIALAVHAAVLYEREGKHATALAELRRVIGRGAPERFWRPFLDLEPLLQPLLLELAEHRGDIEGLPALLAVLGSPYDGERPALSPSLELLTMREAEVFDLLADRLTYKEIAYQLSISPETVKRHVNSIYSKLEVASRREALLKAQELGWHPAA